MLRVLCSFIALLSICSAFAPHRHKKHQTPNNHKDHHHHSHKPRYHRHHPTNLTFTKAINGSFAQVCATPSNPYPNIEIGNYMYFQTDVWNQNALKGGWNECVSSSGTTYTVSFSLWDNTGKDSSVKAYPSIVAGWNFGTGYRYGKGAGGLPYHIQSGVKAMTSWSVQHHSTANWASYDVAWDIWMANNADLPASGTPNVEIMIWLTEQIQNPAGSPKAQAQFWGQWWDFWVGQGGSGTQVWSFKCKTSLWSVTNVDLNDAIGWLSSQWNPQRSQTPQYVIGIQAGQEIDQGAGSFSQQYTLKIS